MEITNDPFSLPALFLIIHYCLVACNWAEAATNITTDQSALLALRSNIFNLDPSHILVTNWSTSTSVCNWVGVTCGRRHKRVIGFNISNMDLAGYLVPQLGNLSFLVSLDLSHNHFQGSVPKELTQMRRLRVLNFSFNNFDGELSSWIGSFISQLQVLRLRNNTFTGVIPPSLSNMSTLAYLDLSYNPLHGQIPPEIGDLQNLQWLGLQYNQLTGSIPLTLFNISKLEILALKSNRLSGNLPDNICNRLPRIERLYLNENELFGKIPSNVSACSEMWMLILSFNKFDGFIPSEIGQMRAIELLSLGDNNLTGEVPSALFNISTLRRLDLGWNQLTGNLPSDMGHGLSNLEVLLLSGNNFRSESVELNFITSLANCRYLDVLVINNNPLNGRLPSSLGNLSSLETILAHESDLKGSIPYEIGNLSNLVTLSVYNNHLTGSLPESLGNLQNLQALFVQLNKINGTIPNSLCKLVNLFELRLNDNHIGNAIPDCFGNLTSLSKLILDNNNLNSIPANMWLLKDLHILSLSANSLFGTLPLEIGNLKAAIQIDLSWNQFSGNIPSTIGELITLINLYLDHNGFEGPIPESVAQMVSLESIDLSHNYLLGHIPPLLQKLQHLIFLNVSFNNLSGEIPLDGPFRNFSSQSFLSNKGLCGDSKYNVPPCPIIHTQRSKRKSKLLFVVIFVAISIIFLVLGFVCVYSKYKKQRGVPIRSFPTWSIPTPLRFSFYELLQATEGYDDSRLLGTGSFGSVYRGTLRNEKDVAVKVFNLDSEGAFKSFEVECKVLRELRHKNLCKVIGSCSNQEFKALVIEYMPNGSLEKWLYAHNYFLDFIQRISIMIDVASSLEYLHYGYSTSIIHCDIKPSNVLLDENMVACLSDFGVSKLLDDGESTIRTMRLATIGYIAPEFGMEGIVSTQSDVYSYGIMLMEIFTRTKPNDEIFVGNSSLRSWVRDSMPNAIFHIVDHNLLKPDEEWMSEKLNCVSSVLELALCCSTESPFERINIKDVHDALKKIKLQLLAYY